MGEYTNEENICQVFLDISRYSILSQEPLILTHNIDSAIGISNDLLVAGPIMLWAASYTGHEVTCSLHLTHILDVSRGFHRIQNDIVLLQGESNIQYYHIPNFELGTFGN